MRDRVALALRLLDDAITEHKPARVVPLFSGGSDSSVSTHIAFRRPDVTTCLFVNTGTALPGVVEHAHATAERFGWALHERCPPDPYEQMIRAHGLPGPGQHGTAYVRLKERTFDGYAAELCSRCDGIGTGCARHDLVMWVTGSRQSESERRMRNATAPVERVGSQIWVNVIYDWTPQQTAAYRQLHDLPLSDVAALVHRSGECNCGTYAQPGERAMLRGLFPGFIDDWESIALEHGHHHAATWGQRPLKVHRDQEQLIPRGGYARACTDCASHVIDRSLTSHTGRGAQ